MSRRALLFVVALLLTAAPLLHQHPLDGASATASAPCVVCAASVTRLPQLAPSVDAPRLVVYALDAQLDLILSNGRTATTPSRAPPAAL